jgi:chlorite dismutase
MNPWIKILCLVAAGGIGFSGGYYVAHLIGSRDLSTATAAWDKEREAIATERADAMTAQRAAEQNQAAAINQAAANYAQGKADAEQNAKQAIADLDAGTRRLRDQWATCKATTAVLSSAASRSKSDGQDGLREEGIRRILSAVGQCQAQRDGLQQALTGERLGQ